LSTTRITETVVVGAGQAGLALSRFLTRAGHEHVVLERGRVGERWRSERWDSLTLLTPNWLNELPGPLHHSDPDGFLSRAGFVDYLEHYAHSFAAPVREGVSVLEVAQDRAGFAVETDAGPWAAANVVIASGYADEARVPAVAAAAPAGVRQLHSSAYRSAGQLPPGGVLVVGAGPSGQQIAAELRQAGREVVLAVGRHAPMRRRYRGRDVWSWLDDSGHLDQTLADLRPGRSPPRS
jgi:putative flavoprotein involved in K+ transport